MLREGVQVSCEFMLARDELWRRTNRERVSTQQEVCYAPRSSDPYSRLFSVMGLHAFINEASCVSYRRSSAHDYPTFFDNSKRDLMYTKSSDITCKEESEQNDDGEVSTAAETP